VPLSSSDHVLELAPASVLATDERTDEAFDRMAFARRAIDLVGPSRTTIVLCEGASRMRVESGPAWGRPNRRWAVLAIPSGASKRAIALAVTGLASQPRAYALDVLIDEACASTAA
jgi:hypothetical protein